MKRHYAAQTAKKEAKIKTLKATALGMWATNTPTYLKEAVREEAQREGYDLDKALAKQRQQATASAVSALSALCGACGTDKCVCAAPEYFPSNEEEAAFEKVLMAKVAAVEKAPSTTLTLTLTLTRTEFSPPYPHVKALRADNGEKFLYEYYVAQLKREEEPGWQEAFANGQKPTRCPCQACLQRRKQCECQRCVAWRATEEGMAALGIPVPGPMVAPLPMLPPAQGVPQSAIEQLTALPLSHSLNLPLAVMAEASGSPAVVEAPVCDTPQHTSSAAAPTTNALVSTLPRASREKSPIARVKKVKTSVRRVARPEAEQPLHAELVQRYRKGRHKDLRKNPCVDTLSGAPYEGGLCPSCEADLEERIEAKRLGGKAKMGPYRHDEWCSNNCRNRPNGRPGKRKRDSAN